MHIRSFQTTVDDLNLVDVIINTKESSLEIQAINEKTADAIRIGVKGCIRIYEMDTPVRQDFEVVNDVSNKKKIKLQGNLSNALKLLGNEKLMSIDLILKIKSDLHVGALLNGQATVKDEEVKISERSGSPVNFGVFKVMEQTSKDSVGALQQQKQMEDMIITIVANLCQLQPEQQKEYVTLLFERIEKAGLKTQATTTQTPKTGGGISV